MKLYSFQEHLLELKARLLRILIAFIIMFAICYYFSDYIYSFLLKPLAKLSSDTVRNIIYTGLAEAFFTYIRLAAFTAFTITIWSVIYLSVQGYTNMKKKLSLLFFLCHLFYFGSVVFLFFIL